MALPSTQNAVACFQSNGYELKTDMVQVMETDIGALGCGTVATVMMVKSSDSTQLASISWVRTQDTSFTVVMEWEQLEYNYGIFSLDTVEALELKGNVKVIGNIGSHANIRLKGHVEIDGDVSPGINHTVELKGHSYVAGSTEPLNTWIIALPLPDFTAGNENLKLTHGTDEWSGTNYWNSVEISGNANLNINDSVTVFCDKFKLTGHAKININGKLVIYCNEFEQSGQSVFNLIKDEEDVKNLRVFVKNEAKISGGAKFYGYLHAPEAEININGNAKLVGTMVGEEITVVGNVFIHTVEPNMTLARVLLALHEVYTVSPTSGLQCRGVHPLLDFDWFQFVVCLGSYIQEIWISCLGCFTTWYWQWCFWCAFFFIKCALESIRL